MYWFKGRWRKGPYDPKTPDEPFFYMDDVKSYRIFLFFGLKPIRFSMRVLKRKPKKLWPRIKYEVKKYVARKSWNYPRLCILWRERPTFIMRMKYYFYVYILNEVLFYLIELKVSSD